VVFSEEKEGYPVKKCKLFLLLTGCGRPEEIPAEPVTVPTEAPAVITENQLGTVDGYDYELWKDYGTTEMTLTGGGTFTYSWSDINNALFRSGRKPDWNWANSTKLP
jgi:hypothetical protein